MVSRKAETSKAQGSLSHRFVCSRCSFSANLVDFQHRMALPVLIVTILPNLLHLPILEWKGWYENGQLKYFMVYSEETIVFFEEYDKEGNVK